MGNKQEEAKERRLAKIRSKYGKTAFQRWGKSGDGSPILKAWKEGRVIIKPKR